MTDAIGQPLEIGDFVTAVWANAEVELFEVTGFENSKIRRWGNMEDAVLLKRHFFDEEINKDTQAKIVKKQKSQITKVTLEAVALYKLSQ